MELEVHIRSVLDRHWVEWNAHGKNGSVGPFFNRAVAEIARDLKENELRSDELLRKVEKRSRRATKKNRSKPALKADANITNNKTIG